MDIEAIEGIGPTYREALQAAGVRTTDDLLERGATPNGRASLADATGITGTLILEWVNHADLMRIDGVGSEYADLLEAAGVDSCLELARRNAANLAITFQELVAARPETVRRIPSEETVAGWIDQAKALPRAVFHDESGAPAATGEAAAASASAPAPAPAPAPEPATRPAAFVSTPAPEPQAEGLWARIKRLFGS